MSSSNSNCRINYASSSKFHQTKLTPEASFQSPDEATRNKDTSWAIPKALANEIRRSFFKRKAKKLQERKKLVAQAMKRRESKRSPATSDSILKEDKASTKHKPTENRNRYKNNLGCNENDTALIKQILNERKNKRSLPSNSKTSLRGLPIAGGIQPNDQVKGDYDTYNVECDRLTKENHAMKTKLDTQEVQTSLLRQQVNDLTLETNTVIKQLTKWRTKSKKLSVLQRKERTKLDNSTDLISQARTALTKALNDASKLEAKIFELETTVDERNRLVDDLYETIERQTQTIGEMTIKFRDKETVLRLNENEKRKLEDEVQVLIASKDGRDLGKTLRRLEREREQWLSDREQKIEALRIELENEHKRSLEREKSRHRQDKEKFMKNSNQKRQVEEKEQKSQQYVNQQMDYMMEVNRELQQKLSKEREVLLSELEEQDEIIVVFELQVHHLNKQIATRNLSEKELILRKAEVESMKEELRDARTQNEMLQKKMIEFGSRDTKEVKRMLKTPRISKKSSKHPQTSLNRKHEPQTKIKKKEKPKESNTKTPKTKTKNYKNTKSIEKKSKKGTDKKITKKKKSHKTRRRSQSNTLTSPGTKKSKKERDKLKKSKQVKTIRNPQSRKVNFPGIDMSSMAVFKSSSNETERTPTIPRNILCSPIQ